MIPVHAPKWTNHNESDPGITLVEVFADLAADDSANDGASHSRRHVTAALTELIANEPAGDAAKNHARALVIYAALAIAAPGKHGDRQ